jgi:hypothetical protein
MAVDYRYLFLEVKGGYGSRKTGWSDVLLISKEPFGMVQN